MFPDGRSKMLQFAALLALSVLLQCSVNAEKHEPHLHPEVKIVGYEGVITKEMLSLFKNAEILEFLDCNFTKVPDGCFSMLPKLRVLYLSNVYNQEIHPDVSKDAPNVEVFHYVNSFWPNASLNAWEHYTNLKVLVIKDDHYFTNLEGNFLTKTKLKTLEISGSGVETIDPLAFNKLDKLETLKLGNNKLTSIPKEVFSPLKSLKELDLQANQLTVFGSSQLPELPNLETLNLSGNPIGKVDINELKKVAPNLKNLIITQTEAKN